MKALIKYTSLFLWSILVVAEGNTANFHSIDSGYGHSLAVKSDGTVWAWGANVGGQLGDGTDISRPTPVQVYGLTDVISVGAGWAHSLAVKRDGTMWAWGRGDEGQLGDGTYGPFEKRYSPVQVALSGVMAIDGGDYYSLAIKSDGTVWGWGGNSSGELGDGTTTTRTTPVQTVGLSDVIAISAGYDHSLALKRDGTVWQWGLIGWDSEDYTPIYSLTPVQVSGLSNVISIGAGESHSLALKDDGTVWSWGDNSYGELGDGSTNWWSLTPVQSLVSGVIAIDAGGDFSLALTSYGTVWWWGSMVIAMYPLPPDDTIQSSIPVPVNISGVKAIAAGDSRALALKNDETLWAWGGGYPGDGTTQGTVYPVQVKGFSTGGSASVPSTVLAADFDEDGKDDPTAISSSGALFYWNSSQSFNRQGPMSIGLSGTPAVGDADGDRKADIAVVSGNPSTGSGQVWYFFLSSRGYLAEAQNLQPTVSSPQPLLADFDGDGKADPTVVSSSGSPSTGSGQVWTVWLSDRGYSSASGSFSVSGATPVAADFDADGRADPVMVDANGNWYFWLSSYWYQLYGNRSYNFGVAGKPVAGDFDGDRKADPAIVDSTGNWNLFLSASFYRRSGPWYLVLP